MNERDSKPAVKNGAPPPEGYFCKWCPILINGSRNVETAEIKGYTFCDAATMEQHKKDHARSETHPRTPDIYDTLESDPIRRRPKDH